MTSPETLWQVFNRLYLGQVVGVDNIRGTVDVVVLDNLGIQRSQLSIPWTGLSCNGQKSSWVRYMPQLRARRDAKDQAGGDFVWVAFGPRNEARILGFASPLGAYAAFEDTARRSAPEKVPYGEFRQLKQGEWDMRSTGGAYVFGSNSGALLLAAGPTTQIRFDKQNKETRAESPLWRIGGEGSFVKVGDVKRTVGIGAFKETDVSDIDPTALKEFWLHLENPAKVPLGPRTQLVDVQYGAVRDDDGIPRTGTLSSAPLPLRRRIKVWDVTSTNLLATQVFSDELDLVGNHDVKYGDLTTKVSVNGGPLTAFNSFFRSTTFDSSINADFNADVNATLSAGVEAKVTSLHTVIEATQPIAGLQLGGLDAIHNVVRGELLLEQVALITTQLNLIVPLLSVFVTKVAGKLGMTPLTDPDILPTLPTDLGVLAGLLVELNTLALAGPASILVSQKVVVD